MKCRISQPAAFDSLCIAGQLPSTLVPTARNLPYIIKKANFRGRGRAQLELTAALKWVQKSQPICEGVLPESQSARRLYARN